MSEKLEYVAFIEMGRYYIFDCINLVIFEVDKATYEVALEIESTGFKGLSECSNDFIRFLIDNELCVENNEIFDTINNRQYDVATISYPTSHRCNLACQYCFASAGENFQGKQKEMTREMVDTILDYTYKTLFKNYPVIKIDFVSGGEPLINFDAILYTVQKSSDLSTLTGKKTEIFICTNATLLNDEILQFLEPVLTKRHHKS